MPEPSEYWSAESDPYRDPATGILKNIPGLQTESALEDYERTIFQAHVVEAAAYIAGRQKFSLKDWQKIHKILFEDVYIWAGELRTIRIKKDNTIFAYPEHVESEAERTFRAINRDLEDGTLTLEKCVGYYSDLNAYHPFREGNGRTQRIIFSAILKRIGYQTDYTNLDSGTLIAALIRSDHGDSFPLESVLRSVTSPLAEE